MDQEVSEMPLARSLWSTGAWQPTLVSVIHMEIDRGSLVHVSLPGASRPIAFDDAAHSGALWSSAMEAATRYYVGSMQQVVVVAWPMPTGPEDA